MFRAATVEPPKPLRRHWWEQHQTVVAVALLSGSVIPLSIALHTARMAEMPLVALGLSLLLFLLLLGLGWRALQSRTPSAPMIQAPRIWLLCLSPGPRAASSCATPAPSGQYASSQFTDHSQNRIRLVLQ